MLWRSLLALDGTAAHDGLTYTLATALSDLVGAYRGDDAQAAAALRILFDPRFAAWYGATVAEASRPPRVVSAAARLTYNLFKCPCASLGVSARADRPRAPRCKRQACACRHRHPPAR